MKFIVHVLSKFDSACVRAYADLSHLELMQVEYTNIIKKIVLDQRDASQEYGGAGYALWKQKRSSLVWTHIRKRSRTVKASKPPRVCLITRLFVR